MRTFVHERVEKMAKWLKPEWEVLDIGCGDGFLETIHPRTLGLDMTPGTGVDIVVDLTDNYFWEYLQANRGEFDCAFMSGILEWIGTPLAFLERLMKGQWFRYIILSFAFRRDVLNMDWKGIVALNSFLQIATQNGIVRDIDVWQNQHLFFVENV